MYVIPAITEELFFRGYLFAALEFYVHACAKLGIEGDASVALRRRVARLLEEKQLNRAYRASHEALERLKERLEQS